MADGGQDAVVHFHVRFGAAFYKFDSRTKLTRFLHRYACAQAKGPRLVADGDAAGRFCLDRHNGDGTASEFGAQFLLDRGEVRVKVEK